MEDKKMPKVNADKFIEYLIIGILWTILNIFFMWLAIDVLNIPTLISSTLVVCTIFVCKFYSYVLAKIMKGGYQNFSKYASIDLVSILLNIFLVWIMIDVLGISTVISSSTVVIVLFVGRFIVFKIIGLIE